MVFGQAVWNSKRTENLAKLCEVFGPEEQFTIFEANKRGVIMRPTQIRPLMDSKLVLKVGMTKNSSHCLRRGVYVIPKKVHDKMTSLGGANEGP